MRRPCFGESPKGGWSAEIKPEDTVHALIAVHTDADITGYGSVFTDGRLVQAGLQVLSRCLSARTRWSRSASRRSCTRTASGWAAAAR